MPKKVFDTLSDKQVEYIKSVYHSEMSHDEKISILTAIHKVTPRTIRKWWQKLNLTPTPDELPKQLKDAWERDIDDDTQVVLVTAAQNKTIVNPHAFRGMLEYKKFIEDTFGYKTQIVVIPSRYRNPTNPIEDVKKRADMWWDHDIDEYLYYNEMRFGNSVINAIERIRPTMMRPLTGLEPKVDECHYIIGHPRIHIKPLPRFKDEPLYVMASTGFITYKNYSQSKIGGIAKIHHTYGFLVIEKKSDGRCYPPRAVKINDDGTFTDYRYHYNGKKVKKIKSAQAYIWGDIHHRVLNPNKYSASMALMKVMNPKSVVLHDLFDGSTINPHEKDDLYIKRRKIVKGEYLVDVEVNACIDFVADMYKRQQTDIYVVQSNHDDFLDRYIKDMNWKNDLHNSPAYLDYAKIQQTQNLEEHGNIIGYLIHQRLGGKVKYVKNAESLKIGSYQCGYHGHHGVNGSRGNVNTFTKLNTKMIHGHVHSPEMCDGVTSVGVSCELWQYYNSSGMSSWAYADSVIHECGKNQLFIFDESDFKFTMLE